MELLLANPFSVSFIYGSFILLLKTRSFLLFLRLSFLSLVKICNHKRLGIYYLLSAFIFGISGTLISVLINAGRLNAFSKTPLDSPLVSFPIGFSINDSVYSCVFFFLTGLHFFHLVVGLLLLSLLFWSCSFSFKTLSIS